MAVTGNIWTSPTDTTTIAGNAVPCPLAVSIGEPWRVMFDISPTSDQAPAQYDTFLAACHSQGLILDVSIWREPSDTFTAAQYIALFQQYAPVIHKYGYRTVFCLASSEIDSGDLTAYYPGDAFVDIIAVDFYLTGYNNGDRLATAAAFADTHNKVFSIAEFGVSTGDNEAQGKTYLTYIYQFLLTRIMTPGTLTGDVLYFNQNVTTGTDPGDFTLQTQTWEIPYYQQIYDLLANSSVLTAAGRMSARGVIAGRSSLAGAAHLTAVAKTHASGVASLHGAGSLGAVSSQPFLHGAPLAGHGTLTATGSQQHPSGIVMQAAGSMKALGISAIPSVTVAFIVLTGRGTIATRVKWTAPAAAAGAGTLQAVSRLSSPSHLTAAGTLSSVIRQLPVAQMTAAGSLAASGAAQAPSSLQGAGSLSAAASVSAPATLTGTAVMAARVIQGSACQMAGAAAIGSPVVQRARAHLAEAAALHAVLRNPGKAKLAGTGHLTPHFKIIIVRQFLDPDGGGRLTAIGTVIDNGPPEPAFTMAQYQVTRAPLIPDPPGHDQPLDPQLTGRALT